MKLETIKLAGFKSFVEPTVIPIIGSLTAIVGPNGCGKSNIIDAIRWVMGESSAKNLRGGHMADVIFNGSATRKPVGSASVELIFNNSAGKLGGEYAQYATIAIKRQVSRDGQSNYFLNGSRCRRKDITDIFLGTGLGARSYAIIEQGTISRMVEAKPDELRVHIEEAAGISKYKERRSETEARMRHTRENLERLADIRDEVGKQLKHLQKQAEKAEHYSALKKQERQYKKELLAMRWQSFQNTADTLKAAHDLAVAEHNRLFREIKELESAIATKRADIKREQDIAARLQADYYTAAADVGKLEQNISHTETNRQQTEADIARLQQHLDQAEQELSVDTEQLAECIAKLQAIEDELEQARDRLDETVLIQQEYLQQVRVWEEQWESYRSQTARYTEQAEVQKVKIGQLESQKHQLQSRLDRLHKEHSELSAALDCTSLNDLQTEIEDLETERLSQHDTLEHLQDAIYDYRRQLKQFNESLNSARSSLHRLKGTVTSLELLQQHAIGKDNRVLTDWLAALGIPAQPRLAEHLDVESGWEKAIETVLGAYLEAVCLGAADTLMPAVNDLPETSLIVFETNYSTESTGASKSALLEKVKAPWPLNSLLSGVYCASNKEDARALSRNLQAHESVITPDGEWFGPNWLKVVHGKDEKTGVLQREKELRKLREEAEVLAGQISDRESSLEETEADLKTAEAQREESQRRYNTLGAELSAKNAEARALSTQFEQQNRRLAQVDSEQQEVLEELEIVNESLAEARLLHEEANITLRRQTQKKNRLEALNLDLQIKRQNNEQLLSEHRQQVSDLKAELESTRAAQIYTARQIDRLRSQKQEADKRVEELQESLVQVTSPLADYRTRLEQASVVKSELESRVKEQRHAQEALETALNQQCEQQLHMHNALENQRQIVDKTTLGLQECQVRQQTVTEQLAEINVAPGALPTLLPPDGNEPAWKKKLDEITASIEKLGTINLTALEEYQSQSERMNFLNEQYSDLADALNTLEQAISKIDHESKLRFQETFDKINAGLAEKFPKLFGGGQAYLAICESNDPDSGVSIVARPPGKKNSSIHLLSGGEKALTAVALVFSIFELNPAPFCLLDEVDAPLDDANVGRFSKMVQDMARTVQFIYISHNKATMEIADQLTGVTMKEPGVSRMVAVDLEEAVSMADV
jgi:chromosome segregation protein